MMFFSLSNIGLSVMLKAGRWKDKVRVESLALDKPTYKSLAS